MSKQPKSRSWPHKVRPVKVSEMRVPPVEVVQRRFSQAQAEEYAADFDLNGIGIPAVNWRDAIYWIVDGQHRIAALKLFFAPSDPGQIDCSVYQDLTDAEMAELFLRLNTRRTVNPYDMFKVACTADRAAETEIRRIVEANGLTITREKDTNCISAVVALRKIHGRAGAVVLGQALRAIRDGFGGDPLAFDGQLMRGVASVFERFNGKTNEREMVRALSELQHGARQVIRKAEALREKTGNQKAQCIAATIVDIYNKGLKPQHRLPSWWKSADEAPL